MEAKNKDVRNAIAIFDIPIILNNGTVIYGMVFDKDTKSKYSIDDYFCYLTAAKDFLRNGGHIKDDKNTWIYGEYNIKVNEAFKNLIATLYGNKIRYTIDYFDEPIVYTEEQVDENCFILDHNLLKTYTDLYNTERTNDDEEIGK